MSKFKSMKKIAFFIAITGLIMNPLISLATVATEETTQSSVDSQELINKKVDHEANKTQLLAYANSVATKDTAIELFNIDGIDGVAILNCKEKNTELIVKSMEPINIDAEACTLTAKNRKVLNFEDPWNTSGSATNGFDIKNIRVINENSNHPKEAYYAGSKGLITIESNEIKKTIELKVFKSIKKVDHEANKTQLLVYANNVATKDTAIELFNIDGIDGVVILNCNEENTELIVKSMEPINISGEVITLKTKRENIVNSKDIWNTSSNEINVSDSKDLKVINSNSDYSKTEYYSESRGIVKLEVDRIEKNINLQILK